MSRQNGQGNDFGQSFKIFFKFRGLNYESEVERERERDQNRKKEIDNIKRGGYERTK